MIYLIQRFRCLKCYREYPMALGFGASSHGPRDNRCKGGAWEPVDNTVTKMEAQ